MPTETTDSSITEATEGVTKAVLEYSEEKIKNLVKKLLQRELAFIEDEETIDIVKTQRKKPEWKLYRKYISNPDLRLQIEMGFSLRKLQNDRTKLHQLRNKIVRKYKPKGLHIAQLVQNGIFGRYLSLLLEHTEDENELTERIEELLGDIDKYVIFLKSEDKIKDAAKIITSKINVLSPRAIIVFSRSTSVVKKAEKVIQEVKKTTKNYRFESQFDQESCQRYDFILKKNIDYFS